MTFLSNPKMAVPKRSFEEAAEWLIRLQESPLSAQEQSQFDAWKTKNRENFRWGNTCSSNSRTNEP